MTEFQPPLSWMKKVFTKNQLDKILNQVEILIKKEEEEGEVDHHQAEILRDKVLVKNQSNDPDIPFKISGGNALEHLTKITENLFLAYPYYFDAKELTALEQNARKVGFNVKVDPYSSRLPGKSMRVIIWKPNQKNAKK